MTVTCHATRYHGHEHGQFYAVTVAAGSTTRPAVRPHESSETEFRHVAIDGYAAGYVSAQHSSSKAARKGTGTYEAVASHATRRHGHAAGHDANDATRQYSPSQTIAWHAD